MHPFAEAHFFFIKARVVMLLGKLDRIMVRMIGLQHDLAGRFAASGASGHLCEQLKRALGSAKVGESQCVVCSHHAHQRHAMNVMSFGDHLCADEKIDLSSMKLVEHSLKVVSIMHGIAIK